MTKVTLKKPETKELKAVLDGTHSGIFFLNNKGEVMHLNLRNMIAAKQLEPNLEHLLEQSLSRTAIYEGDTLTIEF